MYNLENERIKEKKTDQINPDKQFTSERQGNLLNNNQSPLIQNQNIQDQQSSPTTPKQGFPSYLNPDLQEYQQKTDQNLSSFSHSGIIWLDMRMIETELNNLSNGWTILLETSSENALEVSLAMIKILTDKNYIGIILSASRPYENLYALYEKNNIDMEKIFILDLVSKSQSIDLEEIGNVMYLENASALTNISIAIDECFPVIHGKKFIFIDSITTMLIHNKPEVFSQFMHSILTKMRLNGVNSLLVSLENETDKKVRTEISQLCDKILKI